MANPTVVQSVGTTGSVTPNTVTLGTAPTVGNTLLGIYASDTTSSAAPFAGTGNNYTQRIKQIDSQELSIWTRLIASGDSATTTFTPNGAFSAAIAVIEISGTFDTIGTVYTITSVGAASVAAPTVTTSAANELVIAIGGMHGISTVLSTPTVDNGFSGATLYASSSTGGTVSNAMWAQKAVAAAGAVGATTLGWTNNANDRDAIQIAFAGLPGVATASITFSAIGTITSVSDRFSHPVTTPNIISRMSY